MYIYSNTQFYVISAYVTFAFTPLFLTEFNSVNVITSDVMSLSNISCVLIEGRDINNFYMFIFFIFFR